jgi:AcrR family transcriptional regulator
VTADGGYAPGMSTGSSRAPARGRPRSARARRAVLDAARALAEKQGYLAASIEAIAAASGVAKTTIYRSWPSRSYLFLDLLIEVATEAVPLARGKDPLAALRREHRQVALATEAFTGRLLMWLLGEAEHDAGFHRALMQRIFEPRSEAAAQVIRRAQEAGAVRRDVEPLVVVDLLFGPLFYRKLVRQQRVTPAFAAQVFRDAMTGLRPRPGRAR